MAVHPDLKSLVREAVPEYLHVAEYCVSFRKTSGGCLGYPAAVMLFTIADTIGSFYRGRTDLSISIGGRAVRIRHDGFQHLFILNSEFYEQMLDEKTIKRLYDNFRSLLVHNASLAPNYFLLNEPESAPFPIRQGKCCVNVHGFLDISKRAADLFLKRVDEVVPGSEQAANIGRRR